MKISDLMGWAMAILSAVALVVLMHKNASIADKFAACDLRGGTMHKVDGEWLCEVRK